MYLNQETVNIQDQLANYCRTGSYEKIEGVRSDRIHHYRRLVFSNIKNTLETAYPIAKEWLPEEEWLLLVNDFFEHHDAQSPKIWELPLEFMEYVAERNYAQKLNKPALNDLLLIEWVEIEVHTMWDKAVLEYAAVGNLLADKLLLTPEYRLIKLVYPVHIYNAIEAVEKKGDWFIFVFRNRVSDAVQFLNISALHVFVLEKLYDNPQSVKDLLPLISSLFGLNDILQLENHLQAFISDLQNKGALLGFVSNSPK